MAARYFIELSFKGTRFHGWQLQSNALTVQQLIEDALSLLLKERVQITGAGRTDAGVHALYYVAHFDASDEKLEEKADVLYHLNSILPPDVRVHSLVSVPATAHARYDAIKRCYEYHVCLQRNPFLADYACFFPYHVDVQKMNEGAQLIRQANDFTSFAKLHSSAKTNQCKVYKAVWQRYGDRLVFMIEADRFLRNMVRAIAGTLLDVGRGKISLSRLQEIIEGKNRSLAGNSLPPQGLFLTDVVYPDVYLLPRKKWSFLFIAGVDDSWQENKGSLKN